MRGVGPYGRKIGPQEEVDLELLNRILVSNDNDAANEWRTRDAGWRKHIWKLYDEIYLGLETVGTATYL